MLRISKLADYATVIMVHLARHPAILANAKDIAAETRLQIPTVSKILKILASSKLLKSTRGAQGGYSLAHSADDISIAMIIQSIDGAAGLTECSEEHSECVLQGVCSISGNWQLISRAVFSALDSVSLAQLAGPKIETKYIEARILRRPEQQVKAQFNQQTS